MEVDLNIRVDRLPDGGYRATADEFPTLVAEGSTETGAIELARDALRRLRARRDRPNPFAKFVGCVGGFPGGIVEINAWLRDLREE